MFEPEPAVAFNPANDQMKGFEGDRLFLGLNPAPGATLAYRPEGRRQGREVDDSSDADGSVVRETDRRRDEGSQQGRPQHREVGSARAAAAAAAALSRWRQPVAVGGGGALAAAATTDRSCCPGTYRATLTVDGRDAQTVDVVVKGDPTIQITDADRQIWFDTAMDLHQLQGRANDVAEWCRTRTRS